MARRDEGVYCWYVTEDGIGREAIDLAVRGP
jgi:hypothetical protein